MKAKRRHDLQENALGAEIVDIIEFFKKRGGTILAVLLIVVVACALGYYMVSSRTETAAKLQRRLDRAMTDPSLGVEARERELKDLSGTDDKRIAAVASVELGDHYSRVLLFGDTSADPGERRQLVDSAGAAYKSVIENDQSPTEALAKARVGLGKLSETLGDLSGARSLYEAVINTPGIEGHAAYGKAVRALEALDSLGEPVRLAASAPAIDTPKPATPPAGAETPTLKMITLPAATDTEVPAAEPIETPAEAPDME